MEDEYLHFPILNYFHRDKVRHVEDQIHCLVTNGDQIAILTKQHKVIFLEPKSEILLKKKKEEELDEDSDNLQTDRTTGWEQDILFGEKNNVNKAYNLILLNLPSKTNIVQISLGQKHATMVDQSLKAYVYGNNEQSQCGLHVNPNFY